jgi:hypothetical protein
MVRPMDARLKSLASGAAGCYNASRTGSRASRRKTCGGFGRCGRLPAPYSVSRGYAASTPHSPSAPSGTLARISGRSRTLGPPAPAAFGSPAEVLDRATLRSDHGPQYTGHDTEVLARAWGGVHTFAPVGPPTGNAAAEHTIRTMKHDPHHEGGMHPAARLAQPR